jgi:integrase
MIIEKELLKVLRRIEKMMEFLVDEKRAVLAGEGDRPSQISCATSTSEPAPPVAEPAQISPTFAEAAEKYIATRRELAAKNPIQKKTLEQYEYCAALIGGQAVNGKHLKSFRLDEITKDVLQTAFDGIADYSWSVVKKCHFLVKKILRGDFPGEISLTFAPAKERGVWSEKECAAILDFAKTDSIFGLPMYILLTSGIRSGELRALKPSHYDYENHCWRISRAIKIDGFEDAPKNRKARIVALKRDHAAVLEAVLRQLPQNEYILKNAKGKPASEKALSYAYKTFFKRLNADHAEKGLAKIPKYTPHSTRHEWITTLLASGEKPVAVMAMAGHQSLKVTEGYTHLSNFEC